MNDFGGFLGGDGWQLDTGDTRGDVDSKNTTGSWSGTTFNRGGASLGNNTLLLVAGLVVVYMMVKK